MGKTYRSGVRNAEVKRKAQSPMFNTLEENKRYYAAHTYVIGHPECPDVPHYAMVRNGRKYILLGTYLQAPGSFGPGNGYLYYRHPGETRDPETLLREGIFDYEVAA